MRNPLLARLTNIANCTETQPKVQKNGKRAENICSEIEHDKFIIVHSTNTNYNSC